jgi:hypothetical protein
MMMRALVAGGLEAAYSDKRNELARSQADADYQPNPDNELFELETWRYTVSGFPAGYEGRLIKAVTVHAHNMDALPGGTKVVFMRRDTEEIRQSYMAFFPDRRPPTGAEIDRDVTLSLRLMHDRRSFQVAEFDYRSVVADPLGCLTRPRDEYSWPIDPAKAATEVQPDLVRYKAEELTAGIV